MIQSSYPLEIVNHILSHLPTKKGAYERIEHLDLFVRIAFVCKGFRFWVLCSEQGPLKLPEKEVKHYTDSPYATDLRKFICEINLVNAVAPKQAFQFLEKHAYLPDSLKACSPLITNHENESLIDVTISKMEHSNVRGLLEFFFSKLSLNELVEFGKGITNKRLYKWENYIQILDLYFAEIKNKTGDDTLAKDTAQPLLGKILRNCDFEPALIKWISKKG